MKNYAQQKRNELLVAHTLTLANHALQMAIDAAHRNNGGVMRKGFALEIEPKHVVSTYEQLERDAKKWRAHCAAHPSHNKNPAVEPLNPEERN